MNPVYPESVIISFESVKVVDHGLLSHMVSYHLTYEGTILNLPADFVYQYPGNFKFRFMGPARYVG